MKKEKVEQIEEMLSKAVLELHERDYLNLIEKNDSLKKYDSILSSYDDVGKTNDCFDQLDDILLDEIIIYLKEKLVN